MIKERIVISSIYGWEMLEKLLVNNFEWIEDTSQFNKYTMEKVMKVIFLLEFDVQYLEHISYMFSRVIYHFYLKE